METDFVEEGLFGDIAFPPTFQNVWAQLFYVKLSQAD